MKPKKFRSKAKPRRVLIQALAHCVEALCRGPLMEGGFAIRSAIEADPALWEYLDADTIATLGGGLGHYPPGSQHTD